MSKALANIASTQVIVSADVVKAADPADLVEFVNSAHKIVIAAQHNAVLRGVDMGNLLLAVKDRLPNGKFCQWIIDNAEFGARMEDGDQFPPVVIYSDGSDNWLADGYHRVMAATRNGWIAIDADVRKGTRRDAILAAVASNAQHGLRRTNADKRRSVMILLNDSEWLQWSDNKIAEQCGVSHPFVGKLRASCNDFKIDDRIVTRGGKTYRQTSVNIGGKSIKQFECHNCHEHFDVAVWHCPGCDHHWSVESGGVCRNCHDYEFGAEGIAFIGVDSPDCEIDHDEYSEYEEVETTEVIDTDTGEVIENPAVITTTKLKHDVEAKPTSDAFTFCEIAISQMSRIRADDPKRIAAMAMVRQWIDDNPTGGAA